MHRVYKYKLAPGRNEIEMPIGALLLDVHTQADGVYLWALVCPDEDEAMRHIHLYGTGHDIPNANQLKYIGTAYNVEGWMVWHAFEVI